MPEGGFDTGAAYAEFVVEKLQLRLVFLQILLSLLVKFHSNNVTH
jgi:hypothetical protein